MTVVEAYRLFTVAMLDFRFDRLRDVIFAACILGDLVYALICREEIRERIHPLTHKILTSLAPACRKYEKNLVDITAAELLNHSDILARELMEALLDFLPEVQRKQPTIPQDRPPIKVQHLKRKLLDSRRVPITKRKPISQADKSIPLKGLDEVFPPSVDDEERLIRTVPQNNKDDKVSNPKAVPRPVPEVQQLLAVTNETLKKVAGKGHWGDPRVDEVSNEIRRSLFKPGVVEQEIDKTRRKTWLFGCEREGYIHEKILPRSKNSQAVEKS